MDKLLKLRDKTRKKIKTSEFEQKDRSSSVKVKC